MAGEVKQPGAYSLKNTATLFSSLYYFNGPTRLGSLRDIHLIRNNKKITSIDFYDYLLTGKKPQDSKLQLDDIVFIPPRMKTVRIEGEVNREGYYELKSEETLNDLIALAGGLKITAYLDRARVDRIIPFMDREDKGMDRAFTDVNLQDVINSEVKFSIQDGDQIKIFSVLEARNNAVYLDGAVTRPGIYDIGDSLRIKDLIKKADGLIGDAYIERLDVVRTKNNLTEKLIRLDLGKALDGDPDNNIKLQGMDKVQIYRMTEMVSKDTVAIKGHVKYPGRFFLKEGMTLFDLIFKSGGFLDEKYKKKTYLARADLIRLNEKTNTKEIIAFNLEKVLKGDGKANIILQPNDFVHIYSETEIRGDMRFVHIEGHVKNPGKYELFENNMRIHDLLFKAGGFDDPIFKSKTYLDRADLVRFDSSYLKQRIIPFSITNVLSNYESKENLFLSPGDEIRVYSDNIFAPSKTVTINGVIQKPGTYTFKVGSTVEDLILESGGIKDDIYRYRIEIARIDPSNEDLEEYAELINFDIDQLKTNSKTSNQFKNDIGGLSFKLKPYDLISIRPDPFFNIVQKKISLKGEVLYPGDYTILNANERVTDIIERAGGLLPSAYPEASIYTRKGFPLRVALDKILKNPRSNLNFFVQDNDEITIVPHGYIVIVNGEVNNGGVHKYVPGKRLGFYLKRAGGLSPEADKYNIWVDYPNGDSKKESQWSIRDPKIIDGSVINVGKKKESEPFDQTEFAKEVTSILANLAQALAIILLA